MIRNWAIILYFFAVTAVQASKKKGISGFSFMCEDFKVLNNMSWMYDWHIDLTQLYVKQMNKINCPASTYEQYLPEYVPMIYTLSDSPGHQGWIHHTTNVTSNAKYILGFNEPNHKDQANMTPQEAADRWPEVERNSHGIPLVSPAPAGHHFNWLDSFFHLCKGCRVDYVGAHMYSCDADAIMSFLHAAYQRYGKKIWLTEFACPHTKDRNVQLNFMKKILPKLEAADYVFRYSWFKARFSDNWDESFMSKSAALFWQHSSTLTPLGHFYNDFQGNENSAHVVG